MSRSTPLLFGIVAALILAGGGFLAGRLTAEAGTGAPAAAPATPTGAAARGAGGGAGARGPGALGQTVNGRVLSVNADSITVAVRQPGQQQETTSTIALVGPGTRIVRTTETDSQIADIKKDDPVTVVGTADATGTVTAAAIVIGGSALQQLFGAPGGGRPTPSASPAR